MKETWPVGCESECSCLIRSRKEETAAAINYNSRSSTCHATVHRNGRPSSLQGRLSHITINAEDVDMTEKARNYPPFRPRRRSLASMAFSHNSVEGTARSRSRKNPHRK